MKKYITAMLIGALALYVLAGCGSNEDDNKMTPTQAVEDNVEPGNTSTPNPNEAPLSTPESAPMETTTPEPTEAPTEVPEPTAAPTPTPEPHTHSYTESVTKEATCTETGEKTFACDCGDTYTEAIDATGHSLGEYKSNGDATYTADGTETAACTCGFTDTRTVEGSKLTYTYKELSATKYAKSGVNVRDLPSTDGNKLGGLNKGDAVTVTGQCNETGWYRIEYNGSVAYVSNDYLQKDKPVEATPTPEPTPTLEPTPSNPLEILNPDWFLRDDGVYEGSPSTNIIADWEGQTLAEYCATRDIIGVTFTTPWYTTVFMRTDRWGSYVIGSRMLLSIRYEGQEVWLKSPF